MSEGWISEADFAAGLMGGATVRDTVRALRKAHLYEGDDFKVVKKEVMLSPEGSKKLLAMLDLKNGPACHQEATSAAPTPDTGPSALLARDGQAGGPATVKRVWPKNPHYLLASMDGNDVTVYCRETKNFVSGMEIPRGQLHPRTGCCLLFDFTGRCPRGRGRW
jgi:hypothetical protein